jgi:hypothetical protein
MKTVGRERHSASGRVRHCLWPGFRSASGGGSAELPIEPHGAFTKVSTEPPCRAAKERLTIHRAGHDEVSITLSKSDRTGHIDSVQN